MEQKNDYLEKVFNGDDLIFFSPKSIEICHKNTLYILMPTRLLFMKPILLKSTIH